MLYILCQTPEAVEKCKTECVNTFYFDAFPWQAVPPSLNENVSSLAP